VDCAPATTWFKPAGVPLRELEEVTLTLDELEALRLADLEGLYQEAAAERMNVSRATFGRIVESARRKVAEALVRGRALRIEGGPVADCAQCTGETAPKTETQCLRRRNRQRGERKQCESQ
jgi:predicted DNA-binding protein (UPF0251 family)